MFLLLFFKKVVDLKANTEYHNYKQTDPIIKWFWEILGTYDGT